MLPAYSFWSQDVGLNDPYITKLITFDYSDGTSDSIGYDRLIAYQSYQIILRALILKILP